MLRYTVASDADGAVVGNIVPEVEGSSVESTVVFQLCDTFKTDELWHLGIGVLTVEECSAVGCICPLHTIHLVGMVIFLGGIEVFPVSKDMVGISQGLVHASMFPAQHNLHVVFRKMGYNLNAPVAYPLEAVFGCLAAGIYPSVSQSGEYLVLAIEGYPSSVFLVFRQVVGIESCPYLIDGLSADKALQSLCVLFESVLAVFQDTETVVQLFFEFVSGGLFLRGSVS